MKLTREEKEALALYPKVALTKEEFDLLPEYSMTHPTQSGPIGIKRWKRRTPLRAPEDDAIWFLGEVKGGMITFSFIQLASKENIY